MEAKQAEHRRGRPAQAAVGPGQHGAHAGDLITGLERVKRVVQRELIGQGGQRDAAARSRARGGDAQGERQPRAQCAHPGGSRLFVIHPLEAKPRGQQLQRFGFRQHVQVEEAGSVGGR